MQAQRNWGTGQSTSSEHQALASSARSDVLRLRLRNPETLPISWKLAIKPFVVHPSADITASTMSAT